MVSCLTRPAPPAPPNGCKISRFNSEICHYKLQSSRTVTTIFTLGNQIYAAHPRATRDETNLKTPIFVSFDFDHDRRLKDFIIQQARRPDSPFEVIDHSLKEAAPEKSWEIKAYKAIGRARVVLVMVGPHTHSAPGVLKEIRMAREQGKKVVQIIGYRDGSYTPVKDAGQLYRWSWENLRRILN